MWAEQVLGERPVTEDWISLCDEDALEEGQMMAFELGDHQIALYRVGGRYYATTNVCSHAYTLLTDGWLEGSLVECPLHGAQFDVFDGQVVRGPADCPIATYRTRIGENGKVEVLVGPTDGEGRGEA